jgi:predicted nucleotidyltransferase
MEGAAMFPLPHASTAHLTLEETLERLSRHPAVDGLLTIGSTGRATLTPVSDYDVVVVLSEMPVPLGVGITYIDHRLTDVLFVTAAQVGEIIAAAEPLDGNAWVGRMARWLIDGAVVLDRRGALRQAQEKVRGGAWVRPVGESDAYGAWIGLSYNLLHTRRLMASSDPVHRQAAELRISMYGVMNVTLGYFFVRGLRWEGDKAAVRHLQEHDPAFLALLQALLREPNLDAKFALYEQACAASLGPGGELWDGEVTVMWNDSQPVTSEGIERGLAFWEDLVGGA